jgi:hypothetical protein
VSFLYKLSRFGGRWSLLEAMNMEAKAEEVAIGRVFISFTRHQKEFELVFKCKAINTHRLGVGTDLASIHHQGLYTTVDGALGAAAEAVSRCLERFPETQFLLETWGPYRMRIFDRVKRQWVELPSVRMKCSTCGAGYERDALDVDDEYIFLCNQGCDGQLVRV